MKLMTYNIYNGASETLDLVIKAVNQENLDFLCLNEANGFEANDNEKLRKLADLTGFNNYYLERCGDGDDYHVAILTKYQVKNIVAVHPIARAAILVTIETEFGDVTICATHLSPQSEEERLKEVRLILEALRGIERVVIMGDLNSLSHHDLYPEDFVTTFNTGQMRKFTDGQKILFDVMTLWEMSGFQDAALILNRTRDYTAPTSVNQDVEHSEMRLDYVLLSKEVSKYLKDYRVVKTKITDNASDHFPVVCSLE